MKTQKNFAQSLFTIKLEDIFFVINKKTKKDEIYYKTHQVKIKILGYRRKAIHKISGRESEHSELNCVTCAFWYQHKPNAVCERRSICSCGVPSSLMVYLSTDVNTYANDMQTRKSPQTKIWI